MFVSRKILVTGLLVSTISLFNCTVFADPGQGHGMGNAHGQGMGNPHGHGMGNANGQGMGNSHGHSGKNVNASSHSNAAKQTPGAKQFTRFSSSDKKAITNYFNKYPLSATSLPPGIAMNLARGKPLPPGIAKRYLPNDLLTTLPVYPDSEYLLVGKDAVLVNPTTGIITDIIANVLK